MREKGREKRRAGGRGGASEDGERRGRTRAMETMPLLFIQSGAREGEERESAVGGTDVRRDASMMATVERRGRRQGCSWLDGCYSTKLLHPHPSSNSNSLDLISAGCIRREKGRKGGIEGILWV